jgi:hypothetical protein
MASDFTFNIAKGREVEFYQRVLTSDPTNAVFVAVALQEAGISEDADLQDLDTLAAVLAHGTTDEVGNTGYARIELDQSDLAAWAPDDTRDRTILTLPLMTFSAISAGDTWAKLLICYDPDSTGGTDSAVIPVTAHELLYQNAHVVPNGDDIIVDLSAGFVQAL